MLLDDAIFNLQSDLGRLVLGLAILIWARFYKLFLHLSVMSILVIAPISIYLTVIEEDITDTRIYSIYEHALSLVDFTGPGTYLNPGSANTRANNLYRLTWWGNVLNETRSKAPFLGLGFGYDLAYNFMWDYFTSNEPSDTRSPHSIVVTVIGRMGLFGFILFALIIGEMFRNTRRVILQTRRNGIATDSLCYWCMVCHLLFRCGHGRPDGGDSFLDTPGLCPKYRRERRTRE